MTEQDLNALLVDCLHRGAGRVAASRLAALTPEDWESLLTLARRHQTSGLLFHRLKSGSLEAAIPARVLTKLHAAYRANAAQNLRFFSELDHIASAFQGRSIPVIALKGLHLAREVYANPAQREMADLDLLVPTGSIWQAAEILEAQGYRPLTRFATDADLGVSLHLPRFIKPGIAGVELHWAITRPEWNLRLDAAELWSRAVPFRPPLTAALALCPEDLLLHLCIHSTYQHRFQFGLRPSCDIAETIRAYGDALDWPHFVERVRRYRCQRGVYLALQLATELAGAAPPAPVFDRLRPSACDETLIATARMFALAGAASNGLEDTIGTDVLGRWHSAGPLGKLAVSLSRVFLPRTKMSWLYGVSPKTPKIYLYYPVRLLSLFRKHRSRTLRWFRGSLAFTSAAQRAAVLQDWLTGR